MAASTCPKSATSSTASLSFFSRATHISNASRTRAARYSLSCFSVLSTEAARGTMMSAVMYRPLRLRRMRSMASGPNSSAELEQRRTKAK